MEGGKGLLSGSQNLPAYSFLGVLLEAPTAYVRECNKSSGWEEKLGNRPPIRFGPGGELDLRGEWVEIRARK